MNTNNLLKYKYIIDKLKRPATYEEINDYLDKKSEPGQDLTISNRTFMRFRKHIRALFSIDITYNEIIKKYEISDYGDSNKKDRLMEAIDTLHLLNMKKEMLQYIHLEKVRPKGMENLDVLLTAIENRLCVTYDYEKYWEDEKTNREVQPYALKEFDARWYLIGKDLKSNKIKTFGLDRITNIKVTDKAFSIPESFDVDGMYADSYGIITPSDKNQKIEEVVLSFTHEQGKYVESLPLHKSQEIVLNTDDELQIKLELYITHDFVMKLLSYGSTVKVLKPNHLKVEIAQELEKALNQYGM